jgi:Rad3-related DNA helicase
MQNVLPPPEAVGLPARYTEWRENQAEAIYKIVGNDKRTILSICPTGFGKSLVYISAGNILGGKTVILTSTKGLQSQLMRDFEEIGMVDVRGKNAYRCPESRDRTTCDQGICNFGMSCSMRGSGECPYYEAIRRAQNSRLVVTNYAFWLYCNKYGEGIGMPKLLVCDEGHDAPEQVASFLTVTLKRDDEILQKILPPYPEHVKLTDWIKWARLNFENFNSDRLALESDIKSDGPNEYSLRKLRKLKQLTSDLAGLASMKLNEWVFNVTPFEIQFAPIMVKDRCQSLLFLNSAKVLITSGSVNFKTADMLGVTEENCTIDEYPHSFPVESRLVYHVNGARMNAKSSNEDLKEWLVTIDRIVADRQDRKGIIHTTSYARRDFVMAHSKHRDLMLSHHRRDLLEMVRQFKESAAPRVFVSPSVTTGWDFPYEECEYQILGKVPYPDTRNAITKARCEADEEYAPYIAMQQIVQACGRGSRSKDDQCENFIIDDNIKWFLRLHRRFAPQWFLESVTSRIFPPEPPTRLGRR